MAYFIWCNINIWGCYVGKVTIFCFLFTFLKLASVGIYFFSCSFVRWSTNGHLSSLSYRPQHPLSLDIRDTDDDELYISNSRFLILPLLVTCQVPLFGIDQVAYIFLHSLCFPFFRIFRTKYFSCPLVRIYQVVYIFPIPFTLHFPFFQIFHTKHVCAFHKLDFLVL